MASSQKAEMGDNSMCVTDGASSGGRWDRSMGWGVYRVVTSSDTLFCTFWAVIIVDTAVDTTQGTCTCAWDKALSWYETLKYDPTNTFLSSPTALSHDCQTVFSPSRSPPPPFHPCI